VRPTALGIAEIFVGLRLLPEGARRARLEETARSTFDEFFAGRILPLDATVAAVTLAHAATLATRNVAGFEAGVVKLVNPWDA